MAIETSSNVMEYFMPKPYCQLYLRSARRHPQPHRTRQLVVSAMAARDIPISVASRAAAGTNGFTAGLPYQTVFAYTDGVPPRLRLSAARTSTRVRRPPSAVRGLVVEAAGQPSGAVSLHLYHPADSAFVEFGHQLKDAISHVLAELPTST